LYRLRTGKHLGKTVGAVLLLLSLLTAASCHGGSDSTSEDQGGPSLPRTVETPPGFRVAFFGDQGLLPSSRRVLELVRNEGAAMVIHLGDFDYMDDPIGWTELIDSELGPSFPLFAVVGNHDLARWEGYKHLLQERLARVEGANCTGEYGVNAACSYRGLSFLLSGAGTKGSGHAGFIREALARDQAIWRICAWHKNQRTMQVGGKSDEAGWGPYEECRRGGAFIATGHEHSYERTKTLSNMQAGSVDPVWRNPGELRVGGGSTFAFVSGLGGVEIRGRCHPAMPPYGCGREWASVYTSDQGATFGALFIDFNVDGDPRKAKGYFKNIDGEVIDQFTIVADLP
jgi:Calcineurin-like phosphoesterase